LMIYWMQVTTNVSIWCWVLMSVMRYMAVYHPLLQLRLWHLPRRGVQLIIVLSLLLNVSFVGAVQFRERQCQYTSMFGWQMAIRWLNLAEICWGFFIPVLLTMFMDGRVLLTSPPAVLDRRHVHIGTTQPLNAVHLQDSNNTNESQKNAASHRGAPRLRKTIFIWLAITSLDLLLNAPDNFLRLALMFVDEKQPVWQWYWPVRVVSQLCYFSQFAINAISLLLVVYDRSIKPRRSATTTALSMVQQSLLTISPSVSASDSAASARLSSQRSAPGCAVEADISDDSQPQCRTSRTHTL
uniref:G_PROTEIN_RECEP_F1_2 domain-containing protein n=1 Tax=Plectus sambesii TaxID=2011161 RepID=A0A914X669_9BILA